MSLFYNCGSSKKSIPLVVGQSFQSISEAIHGNLYYNGTLLTGTATAEHDGIVVYYVEKILGGLQIFARTMSGQSYTLEVEEDELIGSVIDKIKATGGITGNISINIYFNGKLLHPTTTIKDNEISVGAVLMIVTQVN